MRSAFWAVRELLRACVGDGTPWVLTETEFDGPTGRVGKVTVTTDRGIDAATCIGQAVLGVHVPPFSDECQTVRMYWSV